MKLLHVLLVLLVLPLVVSEDTSTWPRQEVEEPSLSQPYGKQPMFNFDAEAMRTHLAALEVSQREEQLKENEKILRSEWKEASDYHRRMTKMFADRERVLRLQQAHEKEAQFIRSLVDEVEK